MPATSLRVSWCGGSRHGPRPRARYPVGHDSFHHCRTVFLAVSRAWAFTHARVGLQLRGGRREAAVAVSLVTWSAVSFPVMCSWPGHHFTVTCPLLAWRARWAANAVACDDGAGLLLTESTTAWLSVNTTTWPDTREALFIALATAVSSVSYTSAWVRGPASSREK